MKYALIRPISTLLMGITYLLAQFVDYNWLPYIVSFFALTTIVSFFRYLSKMAIILFSSMIVVTVLLFISSGNFKEMYLALNTNVSILALFIFVPLLTIPIQEGRFLECLESVFFHVIKNTKQLYGIVKLVTMSVASVLNMGAIPIVYYLTDNRTYKSYQLLRVKAIGRGFALNFIWSPYYISVALIISYFEVKWLYIAIIGLITCFFGTLLSLWKINKEREQIVIPADFSGPSFKIAIRKIVLLFSIIIGMTIVIMCIELMTNLSVLTIIPIAAIILSLLWSSFYLQPKAILKRLIYYTQHRIPAMGNELSLFIIAGVLGSGVMNIGADEWVIDFTNRLGISHVLLLIPLLFIIINILAFIGIHPIISVTIIAMTFSKSLIFIDNHFILASGLLASWLVAVSISPFSGMNLLMSTLTNNNSLIAGIKNNFLFALTIWGINYLILVAVYLFL